MTFNMRYWVMINIPGDCFASMLRGVIKAFGLQNNIVIFHIILEGLFQSFMTYYFGFFLEQGLTGIWMVRTITIYTICGFYLRLLYNLDWF